MAQQTIATLKQAFEIILGIPFTDPTAKAAIAELRSAGHTEKGISYAIYKSQNKLLQWKQDPKRFWGVLKNEVRKYSWPVGSPRWDEYNSKHPRAAYQAPTPVADPGYIFCLQGEKTGVIYIGYDKDPDKRIKAMRKSSIDTLNILLIATSTLKAVNTVKKEFDSDRSCGDWYHATPRLIKKIDELQP